MERGKFIVIEGGDGAGKDTQIALIQEKFADKDILYVKDPGTTEIGLELRKILQHKKGLSRTAELMLFFASRAQLVEEKIAPAIEAGRHVISHRFDLSTLAYQIHGREQHEHLELFNSVRNAILRSVSPDLYILLHVDPEVSLARAKARGLVATRFEKKQVDFHHRVLEGFNTHIQEHGGVVVDGNRAIEEVHDEIYPHVERLLI